MHIDTNHERMRTSQKSYPKDIQINMPEKAKESSCLTEEENPPLTKEELKQFHRVSEMIKKC